MPPPANASCNRVVQPRHATASCNRVVQPRRARGRAAHRPTTPSLRGGEADAAIQFHRLTAFQAQRNNEKPNPWIAASASPPRNDVRVDWIATSAAPPRNNVQAAWIAPSTTLARNGVPVDWIAPSLTRSRHDARVADCPPDYPCVRRRAKTRRGKQRTAHRPHPVIARRRSRRGNPVPPSHCFSGAAKQRKAKPLDCHVGYASSQ